MSTIIKLTMFLVFVSCVLFSSMAQISSQKSAAKEDINPNVTMAVLTVNEKIVSFELHNQSNFTSKFETFGLKSKPIEARFPVYEKLQDGKWQNIGIAYCATGKGNLLELPPGKKQNVVVDITILKEAIKLPATIRIKIREKVSSKYITSNEFVVKKL